MANVLTDDERKARRLASAAKYRLANREKCREAARLSQAKRGEEKKAYDAKWKAENKDRIRDTAKAYREANKDVLNAKTMEWREANRERFDAYQAGYRRTNSLMEADRKRRWREANKEHVAARLKGWAEANRDKRALNEQNRRARKIGVGGELSKDLAKRLMVLQRGKCACCKTDLKVSGFHLDHNMPLALDGQHEDENIQLLCPTCNLSKHAKHPVDFMRQRGFLL